MKSWAYGPLENVKIKMFSFVQGNQGCIYVAQYNDFSKRQFVEVFSPNTYSLQADNRK